MAREGQGYPCYQRDMMMMIYIYIYIYREREREREIAEKHNPNRRIYYELKLTLNVSV